MQKNAVRNAVENVATVGRAVAALLLLSLSAATIGAAVGGAAGKLLQFIPLWAGVLALTRIEGRYLESVGLTRTRWAGGLLLFGLLPGGLIRLVQAGAEELLYRGYILNRVNERYGRLWGILISSGLFTLMHAMNPGFGLTDALQCILFSILTGIYVFERGEIWGVIALHTIWNIRIDLL